MKLRANGHSVDTRVYLDWIPPTKSLTSAELEVEVAHVGADAQTSQ